MDKEMEQFANDLLESVRQMKAGKAARVAPVEVPHLVPQEVVERVVMEEMTPIRAWREHLGLTQGEVASRMAISQSAFAQMEASSAKVRKSTLRKIAGALGIHVEQLDF